MRKPFIIALSGASAAGKTTFASALADGFSDEEVIVISQDNYYLHKSTLPIDANGFQNFDVPSAFDKEAFIRDILTLKNNQSIQRAQHTFYRLGVEPKMIRYNPAPVIIVEGLFVIHFEETNDLFDFSIYMTAEEDIRLKRRIKRDFEDRGFDYDDVIYRWQNHILPEYTKLDGIYRNKADIIISNTTDYNKVLKMFKVYISDIIEKNK